MAKHARKIIVFSLAGILLSGVGASAVQAAPGDRDGRSPDTRYERRSDNEDRNHRDLRDNRNVAVRRHVYSDDRYRAPHWRESSQIYEHRQPWAWGSRDHFGRQRIIDGNWDREFPGLRSYRWRGPGFWYRGVEHRDLVMFYDDGDALVSVGFWDGGQFIMVRDDGRSYLNHNPFVRRYRNSGIYLKIRL